MSRPKDCVVAVYGEAAEAQNAMQEIDSFGFPGEDVSLVSGILHADDVVNGGACHCHNGLPAECPSSCEGDVNCEWSGPCVPKILLSGENDYLERDAAVGAGVGGLLGMFAGGGLFALINGPGALSMKLTVMATVLVGTCVGAAIGWKVHLNLLTWYGQKVRTGKTLLVVHGDQAEVNKAKVVLKATYPAELHMHGPVETNGRGMHAPA